MTGDPPTGKAEADDDSVLGARLALAVRSSELAGVLAAKLEGLGFANARPGRRGVTFEGTRATFERVFAAPVVSDARGARFADQPKIPEDFGDQVASIYFPNRPQFF